MPQKLFRLQGRSNARRLWIFSAVVLLGGGCGGSSSAPPVAQPATQQSDEQPSAAVVPPIKEPESDPPRKLVRESWEVALMNGAKIGHSHFEEFTTKLGDQTVRELVSSNEMSIQRYGQRVTTSIQATSIETPAGQVLRFGTTILSDGSKMTIEGKFDDGKMSTETSTLGKMQASTGKWDPSWGGFFADQQSLKQKPMQPGETRSIIALVPGFTQVEVTQLRAIQKESVKLLLDEERELLRIESSVSIAGTPIKSILWADEAGEVLKMLIPGMGQETYRTTKENALRPSDKADYDLGRQTVVSVDKPLLSAQSTNRIVYRARLANGSPAETFSNCRSQSVKKIDERTAEITVRAIRPESAKVAASDSGKASEADLQPNSLIQSDDSEIVRLAEQFADGQTDHWTLAKTFEQRVGEFVQSKNFSQAISSAADVVRSREGDCTEHSVLLAALCRAKGIPARVAIGLVYYDKAQGFAYHMWNEVWIADGWVPLDATLGRGGIGAAHLKIADSGLSSASPMGALLPVVEVLGQLELEILSVE